MGIHDETDGVSIWPAMPATPPPQSSAAVAAWFLGPRGENAEEFEHLVVEALRDHVYWRRNFHPEDPVAITEMIKQSPDYLIAKGSTREHFYAVLAALKKSVPFFSMRYQGHMNWDTTIPSMLGYFATMLYNPNNVALEGSTATTFFEKEVGKELCTMMGYKVPPAPKVLPGSPLPVSPSVYGWGHVTCDGTVANLEAMWAARNLKFFPIALRAALNNELAKARNIAVRLPGGAEVKVAEADSWDLLNLNADDILALRVRLTGEPGHEGVISQDEFSTAMAKHSVQDLGLHTFYETYLAGDDIKSPVVLVPGTKHYSWPKAAAVLGLGRTQLMDVEVDEDARMSVGALKESLEKCRRTRTPVLQVVAVVGSTEESAVDPVGEFLKLRESFRKPPTSEHALDFLVHADAAWGGYFATILRPDSVGSHEAMKVSLSPYCEEQLEAIAGTDSVTIDPHKAGYIPYPAGALCYRNAEMRELVTFTAPYIDQGKAEETVGIYGIEGSKPGAAPAAVYLSHRVISPSAGGYGRLLSEAMFSCEKLYARLVAMATPEDPFIIVPLPRLPAEKAKKSAEEVAVEIATIRETIDRRSRSEIADDPVATALIGELGPDLNILAYAFNFKLDNGHLNADVGHANTYNKAIFKRLTVVPGAEIYGYNLILSSTRFGKDYGKGFLNAYGRRLGLSEVDPSVGLNVLRSVVMDPWVTDSPKGSFIDVIEGVLRTTANSVLAELKKQDFNEDPGSTT